MPGSSEFRERGELLMVGAFSNPQEEGSMSVFATRAGAEAFAEGDPFVRNGVVRGWTVREWDAELPAPVAVART